jgi:TRAP-type C4-dicarboxylate transport system permease small subunit
MILHHIRTACVVIGCFALAAVVVLPASQIVLRGLGAPFIGMEELARYFMIVVTFIGIPLVNHEGGHIRMDEIHRFIPIPVSAVLRVLIAIVSGTAFGIVVVAIYSSVRITMGSSTPTLAIPFWLFNAPAILGLGLGALEFFLQAWRVARGQGDAGAPRLV